MRLCIVLLLWALPLHAQKFSACITPRTSTVRAMATNIFDTTAISVSDPLGWSGPPPLIQENYTYPSFQAFTSAPRNSKVYGQSPVIGFEPNCNALRYTFIPNLSSQMCDKYYMGYDLDFPQPLPEVYVEMWVRWDSAFTLQRPVVDSTACKTTSTSGFTYNNMDGSGVVLLMGRVNNLSGAFGLTLGTGWPWALRVDNGHPCYFADGGPTKQIDEDDRHTCGYGLLSNEYSYRKDTAQNLPGKYHVAGDTRYTNKFSDNLMQFDRRWHRYRFWFKAANGVYPNGAATSLWIDDTHLGTITGRDTAADKLIGLSIGRFMWQQPSRSEFMEVGRIRIWATNPGWDLCEAFCS